MNRRISTALAGLAVAGLLSACTATATTSSGDATSSTSSSSSQAAAASSGTTTTVSTASLDDALAGLKEAHSADDVDTAAAATITLSGSGATTDAEGVTSTDGVVTITKAGTYRITGDLSGGVVVAAGEEDKVVLILDGVTITSDTGSALAVTSADEVTVALADGSTNSLTDASTYADTSEEAPNAALWSSADLSITGSGSLTVKGNANDGISSKDGLLIASGTVTVDAADDGVRGKDYLIVEGGTLDVQAGGHALKSDNVDDATVGYIALLGGTITTTSGEDGGNAQTILVGDATTTIDATDDGLHADLALLVGGGNLTIANSEEGLEAATISLLGGVVDVTAADDAINGSSGDGQGADPMAASSDVSVTIAGGEIVLDAGGDGLDSNGTATMTGGSLTVHGPTNNGNGSIDVASGFTITGGTLVAAGASGMAQTPSAESGQGWITADVGASAGQVVTVSTADGTELVSFTAQKAAQNVVVSAEGITTGESYVVSVDGSEVATVTAGEGGRSGMGGGMGGGMRGGGMGGDRQMPPSGMGPGQDSSGTTDGTDGNA